MMMGMMGRHWLFRVSICANLFVLIYLALYSTTTTSPTSTTPIDLGLASSIPNIPFSQAQFQVPQQQSQSQSQSQSQPQQQPPLQSPSSDGGAGASPGDNLNDINSNNGFMNDQSDLMGGSSNTNVKNENQQQVDDRDFNDAVVVDDPVQSNSNSNNNNGLGLLQSDSKPVLAPSSRESVGANINLNDIEDIENLNSYRHAMAASSSSSSSSTPAPNNLNGLGSYFSSEQLQRKKIFHCDDSMPLRPRIGQRGPFWVLYNYFPASRTFLCDEAVTYTTHADFTFLDNLIPLLTRWQGPISISLYAPGTDFNETLTRILYLRECNGEFSTLIKELVSFHIFFDYKHIPKQRILHDPANEATINCSAFLQNSTADQSGAGQSGNGSSASASASPSDAVKFGEGLPTYKKAKRLPYPVNVARNVAREMVTTHYILASDIELYPSPNLITDFLDMIKRNDSAELQRPNPNKLFVISIFEVHTNVTHLPVDKGELVYMLKNKSAIPFHKFVCSDCHRIPKAAEWISAPIKTGLNVFHVGKRKKPFQHWEPIYIGSRFDPLYDERLTWEGRSDKMTQGYVLCVLDYEFHILDNAFLVHRPGFKTLKTMMIPAKNPVVAKQNAVIAKIILPELKLLYGTRPGCAV